MTERDRQRIERGIGKQTAREPKKEIAYHVCISITIYVFACQGEIGRNGGQKKIEAGSNSDREAVWEGKRKTRNGGRERERVIMMVK